MKAFYPQDKLVYFVVFIILVAFSLYGGFRPTYYKQSALEIDLLATRQQYYGPDLGKIYGNRFGIAYFDKVYPSVLKFESAFFSSLNKSAIFLSIYGVLLFLGYKKRK